MDERYINIMSELIKKDIRASISIFIRDYLISDKQYTIDELNELVELWKLRLQNPIEMGE